MISSPTKSQLSPPAQRSVSDLIFSFSQQSHHRKGANDVLNFSRDASLINQPSQFMIMAKKIHFYFVFGHFCPSMSLIANIRGALLTSLNNVTEERRRLEHDRDPLMAIYVISP